MRTSRGCWVLLFGLWGLACGPHWQPPPGQPERPLGMQEDGDDSEASGSEGSVAAGPLVLQGTPEIPAELRSRLAQYENTRSAWLNWLADDGQTLLVTTRFEKHLQGRATATRSDHE